MSRGGGGGGGGGGGANKKLHKGIHDSHTHSHLCDKNVKNHGFIVQAQSL